MLSAPSPVRRAWGEQTAAAPGRFEAKAKKCIAPCSYKPPGKERAGAR